MGGGMEKLHQELSTVDILRACHNHRILRRVHMGTYPVDMLPKTVVERYPAHLCFNHGDSNSPGYHWSGIYLVSPRLIEYCDSLGDGPKDRRVIEFLKLYKHAKVHYNPMRLQDDRSFTCGFFVLSHAHFRSRGLCLNRWLQLFHGSGLIRNDSIVLCHFLSYFSHVNTFTPGVNVSALKRQTCRAPVHFPPLCGGVRRRRRRCSPRKRCVTWSGGVGEHDSD